MAISWEDILKLLLAVVAGGAIGLERQLHHKAAGFRTITLICVGAALFTILSLRISPAGAVASTIITGIGFLGAGVILHEANRVTGLTTAATIWISAAIGMGIGAGAYLLAISAAVITLVVVRLFTRVESQVDNFWDSRQYIITLPCDPQKVDELLSRLTGCGLKGSVSQKMKRQGDLICTLNTSGPVKRQNEFVDLLLADPEIKDIQW